MAVPLVVLTTLNHTILVSLKGKLCRPPVYMVYVLETRDVIGTQIVNLEIGSLAIDVRYC